MNKEKRFRVKYGFNVSDQVSIKETDLEKALYAQKFGEVVQLGSKQVNGRNIIVIEPHYHFYTGWYDFYEPKDGDDFAQIERDCPKLLNETIQFYRERVDYLLSTNRKSLIGKNIDIPEIKSPEQKLIDSPKPKDIQDGLDDLYKKFKI